MVKGKRPQQMNMWQRRYLKAAVLNVGKNGDKEGSKDRVRKSLINLFKKLPWTQGTDLEYSFQPTKFKQKEHLDLMFRLVKQAFRFRFPKEDLLDNATAIIPEVAASKNSRQLLTGPTSLPTASQIESLIEKNVSSLYFIIKIFNRLNLLSKIQFKRTGAAFSLAPNR